MNIKLQQSVLLNTIQELENMCLRGNSVGYYELVDRYRSQIDVDASLLPDIQQFLDETIALTKEDFAQTKAKCIEIIQQIKPKQYTYEDVCDINFDILEINIEDVYDIFNYYNELVGILAQLNAIDILDNIRIELNRPTKTKPKGVVHPFTKK